MYFTRDELLDEVKSLIWLKANDVAVVRGSKAASYYLGCSEELWADEEHYWTFAPRPDPGVLSQIDIWSFDITRLVAELYDLVFGDTPPTNFNLAPRWDHMNACLHALPRVNLEGEPVKFPKCQWLLEYADALALLNTCLEEEAEALSFSVSQISRLANVEEASVRNAMSKKGAERLHSFRSMSGSVRIWAYDAIKWISERRNFRPHPIPIGSQKNVTPKQLLCQIHWNAGSTKNIANALNLDPDHLESILNFELSADDDLLTKLAELSHHEPFSFVAAFRVLEQSRNRKEE